MRAVAFGVVWPNGDMSVCCHISWPRQGHGAASGCMAIGSSPASESLDCESPDPAVSTGPTWRSLFCVVCTQITFGIKNGTIQQID